MESGDEAELLKNLWLFFCDFVLLLIFFCGIAANLLVLLVFYRKPGLRTTANRFVINLTIINIVSCLSLIPITFVSNAALTANGYLCVAEQFSSIFCSSVIVYSVLLIAIDQYFAVVDPLRYHCIISSCKGYLMIISTWGFSAGLSLLGAVRPDFEIYRRGIFKKCEIRSSDQRKDSNSFAHIEEGSTADSSPSFFRIIFGVTHATAGFLIPFVLICFIYYSICVAASGNSKRIRTSILSNEENPQMTGNKSQDDSGGLKSGKSMESDDQLGRSENAVESPPSGFECHNLKPSVVVTRPSPPKPLPKAREGEPDGDPEGDPNRSSVKTEEPRTDREEIGPNLKVESEIPLLKPTLKNNSSFSKLSSVHIQFSNSTKKAGFAQSPIGERRHSNILPETVESEFETLSKARSSSVQSEFCEISSRSSISTRSPSQIQSSRSSSLNESGNGRLPPSRASSVKSTSSCIVHNIRHRISNASLFRYREEARAARISAMVIVMALVCWLPFFVIVSFRSGNCPVRNDFDSPGRRSPEDGFFSTASLLASTIFSPFLFAFRNRKVKKEIRKIFQFCPDLKLDCGNSFYSKNFSLNLKSQAVHLLIESGKNGTNLNQSTNQAKSLS